MTTPPSLSELYRVHQGRVSQKWSSYLPIYERELDDRRRDPLRLLEIGVQNGGSLEIWARYFPEARLLVGCDIDPRCGGLTFDDARIHVLVGDATESGVQERIAALSPEFDVILDDGSHRSPDIIAAFVALFPRLTEGGVYIIEDLHCSYDEGFGGGLFAQRSAVSFLRRLVDVINVAHWGLERAAEDVLAPLVDDEVPPEFVAALPSIASIEFLDSVCVIRRDAGPRPRLGTRIVAGQVADVDDAMLREVGNPYPVERQAASAANVDPLAHEQTIRRLMTEAAAQQHAMRVLAADLELVTAQRDRIVSSRSWRLMGVPRRIFRAVFRRTQR
jgi:hypothetical protein